MLFGSGIGVDGLHANNWVETKELTLTSTNQTINGFGEGLSINSDKKLVVTGGTGSGSGVYLPLTGGTMTGDINTYSGIMFNNEPNAHYQYHLLVKGAGIDTGHLFQKGLVIDGGMELSESLSIKNENSSSFLETNGLFFSGSPSIHSTEVMNIYTDTSDKEVIIKSGINSNGLIVKPNGVTAPAFFESSDERLKKNISEITKEDIEKVKNIELKSFNLKKDDSKHFGVIAQDVEKADLTELVDSDNDGMKSVNYTSFLILKIAELEKEIKQLKSQINK